MIRAAVLAALWPLAAQAAPDLPAGCSPYLTVQTVDCEVDIYMRCDRPGGEVIRIQNYAPHGLDTIEEATADWSLLFSVDVERNTGLVVREGPATPISNAALLADGISTFEYPVDFYFDRRQPYSVQMTGAFRLTGKTTKIDDLPLLVLENRIRIAIPPPRGPLELIQTGYYSEDLDAYMEGAGSLRLGDNVTAVDSGPVAFARPGEAGWLSTVPIHGCGADEAAWSPGR